MMILSGGQFIYTPLILTNDCCVYDVLTDDNTKFPDLWARKDGPTYVGTNGFEHYWNFTFNSHTKIVILPSGKIKKITERI